MIFASLPATGKVTAISPSACTVQNNIPPIKRYAMRREPGPPMASAAPELTNKPVPILVNHFRLPKDPEITNLWTLQ